MVGIARPIWLIGSGGVSTAATTKAMTIAHLRFSRSPCEVSSPTRAISVVTTGSWNTRPKEKISVMIRLRYSDTFGSSEICTSPSPPACCMARKNHITIGVKKK